ncbi:MAG: TonB family protein [Nannocystaceae bacterium]|nr:TonB family protein [Nannocystaceae bacterium]
MVSLVELPVSVWTGAVLAPWVVHLLVRFVRRSPKRSVTGLLAALCAHGLFIALIPDPSMKAPKPPPVQTAIELVEPAPAPAPLPRPRAPDPVVEPDDAEQARPETKDPRPTPRPKVRRKRKQRESVVEPGPPPAPKRFDLGSVRAGPQSGIAVQQGVGGGTSLQGDPGRRRDGPSGRGAGSGVGAEPRAQETSEVKGWAPSSRVSLGSLPKPKSIRKRQCPATKEGVQGTVFMRVQVRSDGSVRKVVVTKGIGNGCDEIAAAALRRAKFDPARSSSNKPVDFEIRYEYAFSLSQ